MNLSCMFPRVSAALILLAVGGCQKAPVNSSSQSPQNPAQSPLSVPRKLVSAEPSSFDQVTRNLDAGGSAYLYLSTETFLKQASDKLAEVAPVLLSAAKMSGVEKDKAEAAWKSISRVTATSGLKEITGFGASSIALSPGYYQTKWMLHHYEGKGDGFLWKLSGSASDALDIIAYLPANTAMAGSGDFTFEPIWNALTQEAATNSDLHEKLQSITQPFEQMSGLKLDHLLASIGPSYSYVLTLDETRKATLPGGPGGNSITLPEPALAVLIQVKDEALLARLDQELTKAPGVVNADQPEMKVRVIPVPVPMPFVRPAVAWKKDLLILTSNEALARELFDVKAGKKAGIAGSAEFKKMMANMPAQASQFQFVTPVFQKTVKELQTTAMQGNPGVDPAVQQMLMQMIGSDKPQWSCSMVQDTPEGLLGTIHSASGATQVVAIGAAAPVGLLSAFAVPNFLRAHKRSQATRVLEDLRIIDAAIDQYAIEKNKATGTVVGFEEIQPYIKPSTRLYSSNNKDIFGNPFNNGEPYKVDSVPKVNAATFQALSDVADATFWSPYQ